MASRQTQAVSKPLLIVLGILIVIFVVMYAMNMAGGSVENQKFEGVPEEPEVLEMPVLPPGGPQPTTGG